MKSTVFSRGREPLRAARGRAQTSRSAPARSLHSGRRSLLKARRESGYRPSRSAARRRRRRHWSCRSWWVVSRLLSSRDERFPSRHVVDVFASKLALARPALRYLRQASGFWQLGKAVAFRQPLVDALKVASQSFFIAPRRITARLGFDCLAQVRRKLGEPRLLLELEPASIGILIHLFATAIALGGVIQLEGSVGRLLVVRGVAAAGRPTDVASR